MSDRAAGFFTYNSQLVSSFYHQFVLLNDAEFSPEDAFTLYHLTTEEQYAAKAGGVIGPVLPALGHALAGGLASALSKAAVYPIDTIVTRMQVQKHLKGDKEAPSAAGDANVFYHNPVDAANKIYKNEGGLKGFYAGLGSDVVKAIADSFLFFLAYNAVRDQMLKREGAKRLPVLKELSVGIIAGALSKAVTQPISNIVVRQQTAALIAARDPESSSTPGEADQVSVKEIARQIRNEKGVAGFWAGYSPQIILTLNPAITFAVDNLLKGLVPKAKRDSASVTFLVAAISKVVATSLTYPVMLAKSRAQATRGSSTETEASEYHVSAKNSADRKAQVKQAIQKVAQLLEGQTRIFVALQKIYRKEGIAGLYCGLEGEVVKGFLQHGITMAAKDGVHVGVVQLYYIVLRLTKRWDAELAKAQSQAAELANDAKHSIENATNVTVEAAKKAVGQ